MRTKLGTCRRKKRFRDAQDAVAAVLAANVMLRPYRCDRCNAYHLTSRIKGKWMPIRQNAPSDRA